MGVIACLLGVSVTSLAQGQADEQRAAARAAAQQGVAAFNEGKYDDAANLLERAESVVHAPTHLLFIARSYEKLGKLVRAREMYIKVRQEELASSAPRAFRDAKVDAAKELAALEPRLSYVNVAVQGAPAASVKVSIDDTPMPQALVGLPQPTDPGTHTYLASAEGFESARSSLVVKEGSRETILLALQPSTARAQVAAPGVLGSPEVVAPGSDSRPPDAPADTTRSGSGLKPLAYAAIGVGVVGVAMGTFFIVRRSSKVSQSDDLFNACNPRLCSNAEQEQIRTLEDGAASAGTLATVGFVAGGVALAAGVTLLVLEGGRARSSQGVSIQPWVGARSLGLTGQF